MSQRTSPARGDELGLTRGRLELLSVGPIAFGLDGILFVADNRAAAVCAVDVGPASATAAAEPITVDGLDTRLAAYLGCSPDDLWIRDLAVRPGIGDVYLSVTRGSGAESIPLLVRLAPDGAPEALDLEDVWFSRARIEDAPAEDDARLDGRVVRGSREGEPFEVRGTHLQVARDPLRSVTVTDLAYVDGTLLMAGASNEEFSSSLRRIRFPFDGPGSTSALEIFHVSLGRFETASPIRTFVPFSGGAGLLASTRARRSPTSRSPSRGPDTR